MQLERDIPYWALKSLWSLTKSSASLSPEAADEAAGSADEVDDGTSSDEAAAEEAGSSEADSVGSGAKTPVLIEVGSAEAEADSSAELVAEAEATDEAAALALALALTLAEADGRVQALFLATGDPNAGAAKARTGRIVKMVENFIVYVFVRSRCV